MRKLDCFIVVFCLVSWVAFGQAPNIRNVSVVPSTIKLGDWAEISVEVENTSSTESGDAAVCVSFPDLTSTNVDSYVYNDGSSSVSNGPGYKEYDSSDVNGIWYNGEKITPTYLTVQLTDFDWHGGATNTLKLRVQPQSVGTFEVYVRATMNTSDGYINWPTSSDHIDQQGWPCHRYTITVEEPPLPDLSPHPKPGGWDDNVVISAQSGTRANETIYVNQTAYIDYAVANSGDADAPGGFYVELWDDTTGEQIRKNPFISVQVGYVAYHDDAEWIFTSPGWHTIRVKVDADDDVAEKIETNNEDTIQVYVNEEPEPLTVSTLDKDGEIPEDALTKVKVQRFSADWSTFYETKTAGANGKVTYSASEVPAGTTYNFDFYYEGANLFGYVDGELWDTQEHTVAAGADTLTMQRRLPYCKSLKFFMDDVELNEASEVMVGSTIRWEAEVTNNFGRSLWTWVQVYCDRDKSTDLDVSTQGYAREISENGGVTTFSRTFVVSDEGEYFSAIQTYIDKEDDGQYIFETDAWGWSDLPSFTVVPFNDPPTLNIIEPALDIEVNQGDSVSLTWEGIDPDDEALVSIGYDVDNDPDNGNHVWIGESLSMAESLSLDTSDVDPNTYYIIGRIDDGKVQATSYAEGTVSVLPDVVSFSNVSIPSEPNDLIWLESSETTINPTVLVDARTYSGSGVYPIGPRNGSIVKLSTTNSTIAAAQPLNPLTLPFATAAEIHEAAIRLPFTVPVSGTYNIQAETLIEQMVSEIHINFTGLTRPSYYIRHRFNIVDMGTDELAYIDLLHSFNGIEGFGVPVEEAVFSTILTAIMAVGDGGLSGILLDLYLTYGDAFNSGRDTSLPSGMIKNIDADCYLEEGRQYAIEMRTESFCFSQIFSIVGAQFTTLNTDYLLYDIAISGNAYGQPQVNHAPSDIQIGSASVDEGLPLMSLVGTFSTSDVDINDSHVYELIQGEGDQDNNQFSIAGNVLRTYSVFDYETENSYSIRVKSTDEGGETVEKTFAIVVLDMAENNAPTGITLSDTSIAENQPVVTMVGTLSAEDPDGDNSHLYTLVSGEGDADNTSFTIDGNTLKTAEVFDYETQDAYNILVRATDMGGLFYEKKYVISILDISGTTEHTVMVQAGQGGSVNPEGANVVPYGDSLDIDIVPGSHYQISDVLVDGKSVGILTGYVFSNVTADHSLSASFELAPFQMEAESKDLNWRTHAGWYYTIWTTEDLSSGAWVPYIPYTNMPGTDSVLSVGMATNLHSAAYYKVEVSLEPLNFTNSTPSNTMNMVANYSLDGDGADATTNSYDGIVSGAVTTTNRYGEQASALYFDGNDSVNISPAPTMTDQMSISLWFRCDNVVGSHSLVSKSEQGDGRDVEFNLDINDGLLRFGVVRDNGATGLYVFATTLITASVEWSHVVASIDYDNDEIRLYLNGSLVDSQSMEGLHVRTQQQTMRIGSASHWSKNDYFQGALDDVQIYSRALEDSEILVLSE